MNKGYRWSKQQHLKFANTQARKRRERFESQQVASLIADAQERSVPTVVNTLSDSLNDAWSKLSLADKLRALAHVLGTL